MRSENRVEHSCLQRIGYSDAQPSRELYVAITIELPARTPLNATKPQLKKIGAPANARAPTRPDAWLLADHRQLFLGLGACGVDLTVTANDDDFAVGRLAVNHHALARRPFAHDPEISQRGGSRSPQFRVRRPLQTRASPSRLLSSGSYGLITSSNKSRSWNRRFIE